MNRKQTIDQLWADAGRGTRREDIEAAYAAGEASAFVAGFICAGGELAEAKSQAAQFAECVRAGKTPNARLSGTPQACPLFDR